MNEPSRGKRIHVNGVVQGVGFRPFVYRLAEELSLKGWVRNTSAGVVIEVNGPPEAMEILIEALRERAPQLARLDKITVEESPNNGFRDFQILRSEQVPGAFQPISPDASICPDCLQELFDPDDFRYRYPFINCTNCGPRFTIITDVPYDRPNTTMAPFEMCAQCSAEYHDPLDRRFHAQPVACHSCGPHVWLEINGETISTHGEALDRARRLLLEGNTLAVKGLGGFHLACDAANPAAVAELRRRKLRVDKPFALMMHDLETVEQHCFVDNQERDLLTSHERPIVVLRRRPGSSIAKKVAPGQATLGVMLPYTPLHYLLLEPGGGSCQSIVMTSGNLSEEPIATKNEDARQRLTGLADAFLMHNRDIRSRCDDSVVRAFPVDLISTPAPVGRAYLLRRSRGYAPLPVHLPWEAPSLLATGSDLKNTICMTRDRYAFLSHHIGDMENLETLRAFEETIALYESLFRIEPEALAYDLHPAYQATCYAKKRSDREGIPAIAVQHHHAHIAACMAENGLAGERPVIGVAFDGTGYGDDGTIWGGEFLVCDYRISDRHAHLKCIPLAGGDAGVREPWRMALAWLDAAGIEWDEDLPPVRYASKRQQEVLQRQLETGLNAPLTSSMGRLFDAVSALTGVRQVVTYEAQAAIELEALADTSEEGAYPVQFVNDIVDPKPLFESVVADMRKRRSISSISARFHNSVADMTLRVCKSIRDCCNLDDVVLSGGVWQNMLLLTRTVALLQADGFKVHSHSLVPANDGGLALGQAVIAANNIAVDASSGRRK